VRYDYNNADMADRRRFAVVAVVIVVLAWARAAHADQALSLQQAWALAASALLTERNGERHDRLSGTSGNADDREDARRLLRDWWGVSDRRSLLDSLEWIEKGGHRHDFALTGQQLTALTPEQRQALEAQRRMDPWFNKKMLVVEAHYAQLGAKSIVGWDFSRYISVCRWGYAAGYLTEPDAWARIMPAARIIRYTFTSWREVGENYMIGRQYWSPEQHVQNGHFYRLALERLLADPASPWNRVPWDVDLGPPRQWPGRPSPVGGN
jgi:hypothetical protein